MVTEKALLAALDGLKKWSEETKTRATWVNWRDGYQIRMYWYGNESISCYLDFGKDSCKRDEVLKAIFDRHARQGQKPSKIDGHGWSRPDYTLY
jgi:hypothetical protein